jgi:pyruvate dehydrogenase E2 component (dihydrolipoamide acetyltransferase)
MGEATIIEWMLEVGERVEKGAVLATVESEKATMELPSPVPGLLAKYLVEEGETIPVGTAVCMIAADEGELEKILEGAA